MIALDTNILARYLLADDPIQAEKATQLIENSEQCFIPITVGLELAWVLRSNGILKEDIIEAFENLLMLQNLYFQFSSTWYQALIWAKQGMDIADALHVALSNECTGFYSFDKRLLKRGEREHIFPVCIEPK
ncbi:MAG: type II toxin-antitoxin system VapC family toxin [Acinetobacter sp.]|nr:MAG: type II toxin-antitoxin system VapC family toxin [Acinetobacter sp.]